MERDRLTGPMLSMREGMEFFSYLPAEMKFINSKQIGAVPLSETYLPLSVKHIFNRAARSQKRF